MKLNWIAYAIAWIAATVFWTLASASSVGWPAMSALPFAVLAMGTAATMGVGVWWLTGRVAWDLRSPLFYATHVVAMTVYIAIYATSYIWLDVFRGRGLAAIASLSSSSIVGWNLLMGWWLYLIVAGLSYGVRARRELRAQEAAAAEARLLAKDAQLAALRAQINPHFLFNALHSVGALVSIDPARADAAIECLGDLLRYALDADDQVRLSQEWRFTQDYLAFERIRMGDRLTVEEHLDEQALHLMVPPLLLQPIVENAVRHGIADRASGGRISLSARVLDGQLRLVVTDDGIGPSGPPGDGLGLASVRKRLDALYGARASVGAENGPRGFTVTVNLPALAEATDRS